ncbi:MAG: hypothetical protein LBK62_12905 [Treponema sp.]|nr:hypothetical protein [Treponema sp.]
MKIKYLSGFLLAVSLVLVSVSCKSAPAPIPEEPSVADSASTPEIPVQPSGPAQASLEALQEAVARAEEARKRALDFESPSYFPTEWETAEAQNTAAGNLPTSTDTEVQEAVAAYKASADAFDELFSKTIPLYAQAREDEVLAARNELIATGLTDTFPEYLREADETALSALDQYEQKDYYAARDTAGKAMGKYVALKVAADAWLTREEIVNNDFAARDGFAEADETALAAIDAYSGGDLDSALQGAEEARRRYTQVLTSAWAAYAADMGEAARRARQTALNLKANVAVRDTFNEAEGFYTQAAAALRDSRDKDAAGLYTESEIRFVLAGQAASEKRQIAEEAIREAEKKIEDSDEVASQAELFIQGGSI